MAPGAALKRLEGSDPSIVQLAQLCDSLLEAASSSTVLRLSEEIAGLKKSADLVVNELECSLNRKYERQQSEICDYSSILKRRKILSEFRKKAVLQGITVNNQLLCEAVGLATTN